MCDFLCFFIKIVYQWIVKVRFFRKNVLISCCFKVSSRFPGYREGEVGGLI